MMKMVLLLVCLFSSLSGCSSAAKKSPHTAALFADAPESLVFIRGGDFIMGSPPDEPGRFDNERQHTVTISPFYLGSHEVTQKEWQDLMGKSLRQTAEENGWDLYGEGDNYPVYYVSWNDAVEYCNALSLRNGLEPAYSSRGKRVIWNKSANGYRLPTEAEWEYACRAGTATPFSTGKNITAAQANYDGEHPYNNNPRGRFRETAVEVESFPPNPWGLYDMHGNVCEWCWDWYEDSYSDWPQTDPQGASSGSARVFRGGSWINYGRYLRSSYRNRNYPVFQDRRVGFRLARNAAAADPNTPAVETAE
jgi:formylglycine-generating enzyme required for sulfatase activity